MGILSDEPLHVGDVVTVFGLEGKRVIRYVLQVSEVITRDYYRGLPLSDQGAHIAGKFTTDISDFNFLCKGQYIGTPVYVIDTQVRTVNEKGLPTSELCIQLPYEGYRDLSMAERAASEYVELIQLAIDSGLYPDTDNPAPEPLDFDPAPITVLQFRMEPTTFQRIHIQGVEFSHKNYLSAGRFANSHIQVWSDVLCGDTPVREFKPERW